MSIVDLRFSTNSTKSSNDICFVQNIWEPYVVYFRICFDLLNFFCRGNCPSYWTFFIPSMVLQSINLMKWFSKSSIYIFNLTVPWGICETIQRRGFSTILDYYRIFKPWKQRVDDIIFNNILIERSYLLEKWFIKNWFLRN